MDIKLPLSVQSVEFASISLNDTSHYRTSNKNLKIDDRDFIICVKSVATYRVKEGDFVTIDVCEGADESSVNLFLNGSVFGALLHQRALLPLHGCSIKINGNGVIICGSSGAGKSSLTYALCRGDAQFINDDITPLRVTKHEVKIVPLESRIKLWDDTLSTFGVDYSALNKIRPQINKFYTSVQDPLKEDVELQHIIILSIGTDNYFHSKELTGTAKYNALRRSIYRKHYLKGMPETEKLYFNQLMSIAQKVRVTLMIRPKDNDILESTNYLKELIINGSKEPNSL